MINNITPKFQLEQWGAAVEAYDKCDYELALNILTEINKMSPSAKFHFNIGLIYAALGEHQTACQSFKKAISLDQYFAVAYFQKGVSHFLLGQFNKALANFNDTLLYLRGNQTIDYEQLGLRFRLYSCEILFNRGLCYMHLGITEQGENDHYLAVTEKQTEDHDIIIEAMEVRGQGFSVFSVPLGVIFRPREEMLENIKTKICLGKAKCVASWDLEDKARMNSKTVFAKAKTEGTVDAIPRPHSSIGRIRLSKSTFASGFRQFKHTLKFIFA